MLARLTRELPTEGFVYEPKWDGFRCIAFCDSDEVDLRSRNERPLARYFPEIVEALERQLPAREPADLWFETGDVLHRVQSGGDTLAPALELHQRLPD